MKKRDRTGLSEPSQRRTSLRGTGAKGNAAAAVSDGNGIEPRLMALDEVEHEAGLEADGGGGVGIQIDTPVLVGIEDGNPRSSRGNSASQAPI